MMIIMSLDKERETHTRRGSNTVVTCVGKTRGLVLSTVKIMRDAATEKSTCENVLNIAWSHPGSCVYGLSVR